MPARKVLEVGDFTRAIAEIIDNRFRAISMSQETLGSLVGISQSQLSKDLRGERAWTTDQLDAICRELGVSIVEVIDAADYATRHRHT